MILNRENAVIELKDQTIKEYGGIEFQEIAFAQKINLRGNSNNKSFMTLQGKLLDAVLPTKSNTYTNNGKIKILWLGPNEWLIVDEDKKKSWYLHWITEVFSAIEQSLKNNDCEGQFCFGESPSLADVCLIPQVYNGLRFHCDLSEYPIIQSIWDHCMTLEAFKRAAPESQPDAPEE